jgi:hypothetical protein
LQALPRLSRVSTIAKPVEARPGSTPIALILAVIYNGSPPQLITGKQVSIKNTDVALHIL